MLDQAPASPTEGTTITDEEMIELRRRLLSAIRRVCPPWLQNQAEDIAQEALIKMTHVLAQQGERDGGFPASYINKVAYTTMVDQIRHVRLSRTNEVAMQDDCGQIPHLEPTTNPEAQSSSGRLVTGIAQCLEKMVKNRRKVVFLRLQGHSVPEISTLLGWPLTRANNLVFRGLKDLRRCLEKKGLAP